MSKDGRSFDRGMLHGPCGDNGACSEGICIQWSVWNGRDTGPTCELRCDTAVKPKGGCPAKTECMGPVSDLEIDSLVCL